MVVVNSKRHRLLIIGTIFTSLIVILTIITYMNNVNVKLSIAAETAKMNETNNAKQLITAQESARKSLIVSLENNLRHQMRLNLEAVGKVIEEDIEYHTFNNKDDLVTYINKKIKSLAVYQRTYNEEGKWFSMISIGPELTFNMDINSNSGPPMYGDKPMIPYEYRDRTRYDEVVWQDEAKYLLYLYGIINKPGYLNTDVNFPIINTKFKFDEHLNNVEVITDNDIQYIQEHYPIVIDKMRELKIIMQYDTTQCNNVMNFINYNRSTVYSDNLYWYYNKPEPYETYYDFDLYNTDREILEIYVIPHGVYGFFNEPKMKSAGVFNKNYVKVSLVAGAQLLDYLKTYDKSLKFYKDNITEINSNLKVSIDSIDNMKTIAIKSNWINMSIVGVIYVVCMILCLYYYTRIPYSLLDPSILACVNKNTNN